MRIVDSFKKRLIEAIEESGMSQVDVAAKSNISKSLLNKYIKGVSQAGNHKLLSLARTLGVSPVWLMGYDVDKRKVDVDPEFSEEKKKLISQIIALCEQADESNLKTIIKIIKSMVE